MLILNPIIIINFVRLTVKYDVLFHLIYLSMYSYNIAQRSFHFNFPALILVVMATLRVIYIIYFIFFILDQNLF